MGRKIKKTYSIDEGTAIKFQEVCEKNELEFSATLEKFMENFIKKDMEALVDDLYAPRIAAMVRNEIVNEMDRMARMNYNNQVDITAILLSIPSMYLKNAQFMENLFETWINPELLLPEDERPLVEEHFQYKTDGNFMISNLREAAIKEIKRRARDARAKKDQEKDQLQGVN